MSTCCNSSMGLSTGNSWLRLCDTAGRRFLRLDSGKLCGDARSRTGLEDFGDAAIESRLSVLVNSLESEANLHPVGRFLARRHLQDLLETRLRLAESWRSRPRTLAREPIRRPIFITGMPRSGSTFLHELLAQDPANRAPLVWEVMLPLPTPSGDSRDAEWRKRKSAACLWAFRRLCPRFDSVHPLRATTPQECVAIHSSSFLSQEFCTMFHVPAYEAFLNATDLTPAYHWQKRFLQHLQLQCPVKQWVLKAPDHVLSLDALFAVFPDAVVIHTHRDASDVLKSSNRLVEVLRRAFAWPEELEVISACEASALARGMSRISLFRDSHPELARRFLDVDYQQIVAEPLATLHSLYQKLNLQMTHLAIERVSQLAAGRARYENRGTPVAVKDFGIGHTPHRDHPGAALETSVRALLKA